MSENLVSANEHWWGDFRFDKSEVLTWDFRSLEVSIQHLEKEWCVWYSHDPDHIPDKSTKPTLSRSFDGALRPEKFKRFVYSQTADQLDILPSLPDRNLVVKPINPITLMPAQETTLFVGALVWFTVRLKKQSDILFEVPLGQLSDTWFGPSSQVGELCYASKTHAYIDPSALSHRAYRAIVPVTIKNDNRKDPLTIEKINVPVMMLDLYSDPKGLLWTNTIHLTKEAGSSHVRIKVESARRNRYFSSAHAKKVAGARKPEQNHLVLRAYDMLFS